MVALLDEAPPVDSLGTPSEGALEWWESADAPWDRLELGKHEMPGIWEIVSGECARQVDHKKTKGKDGAHIKDLGVLPSRFTARGRMISYADWVRLQEIVPDLNPRSKGGLRKPTTIYHPAVALLGVNTVYVERIRVPTIRTGILEIHLDLIEWTEPKPTRTTKVVDTALITGADYMAQVDAEYAKEQEKIDAGVSQELLRRGQHSTQSVPNLNDPAAVRDRIKQDQLQDREFRSPSDEVGGMDVLDATGLH